VIAQSFFLLGASILGARLIGKSGNLRLFGGALAVLAVIITFMFAASVPDVSDIGYNAILIRAIYLAVALMEVGAILRVIRRRQNTRH